MGDIIKNKDAILSIYFDNNDKFCRISRNKYSDLNNKLWDWVKLASNSDLILTEDIIKIKAQEIAKKLKLNSFIGSNGWLYNFKKRFKICERTLSGETAGINIDNFYERIVEIKRKVAEFDPPNVYNMDETGLFYKEIPSKTN
ncbi:Tigger transposable element-derived protein 4 [Dictyocoela muelleri]|nr:Tigger transposable element-derived protein 4 [Dictyocoela muelleri]